MKKNTWKIASYKTIMEKELLITKYKHNDNMKKKVFFQLYCQETEGAL